MAYANGVVYIDTSVTPNIGVSIYDVQRALGTSECDLGSLCTHDNINKWARYKPENIEGQLPITHGSSLATLRSRKRNNFGLTVPYCTNDIMNAIVYAIWDNPITNKYWEYIKPQGLVNGVRYFYRLTDFVRLPDDSTDPYYGTTYARGYNQNAEMPFSAFISAGSAQQKSDEYGVYYEINTQGVNQLVITFFNSRGDELHLQDFIDLGEDAEGYGWRPVIQVFNSDPSIQTPWYNRGTVDHIHDVEFAGGVITNVQGGTWTVTLPLDDSRFVDYINKNVFFHMCVGVGCCKQNLEAQNPWKGNNALFILPYNQADAVDLDFIVPFYYRLKLVNYFNRQLRFLYMIYGSSSAIEFVSSTATIPGGASGTTVYQMTINESTTQKLHFVGQYGQADTGYESLKICLEDAETHRYYYLNPVQGLNHQAKQNAYVELGSGTTTLYGESLEIDVNNGNLPQGGYWRFQVKAYIGTAQPDNAGSIAIHKNTL
jgi:hypothetical protein